MALKSSQGNNTRKTGDNDTNSQALSKGKPA